MAKRRRRGLGSSSAVHRSRGRMDATGARGAAAAAIKYAHSGPCTTAVHYLLDAAEAVGKAEESLASMASGKKRGKDYEAVGLAKADVNRATGIVLRACVLKGNPNES